MSSRRRIAAPMIEGLHRTPVLSMFEMPAACLLSRAATLAEPVERFIERHKNPFLWSAGSQNLVMS